MDSHLFLYGTSACHLCEQAEAILQALSCELSLRWTKIDIADDDALVKRYGIKIPVLHRADSAQELCWPFTVEHVRTFVR